MATIFRCNEVEMWDGYTIPKFTDKEEDIYKKFSQDTPHKSALEEYVNYSSKETKSCSKCGKLHRLCEYKGNTSGKHPFDRNGNRLRRPECSDCGRMANNGKEEAKKVAKTLGIPYKAPEGTCCALCGKPAGSQPLVFDHCHRTNTFRGYLHNSCNRSMGVLGDDVEGLLRALNFLNKSEKKKIIQDEMTGELKIEE